MCLKKRGKRKVVEEKEVYEAEVLVDGILIVEIEAGSREEALALLDSSPLMRLLKIAADEDINIDIVDVWKKEHTDGDGE